MKHLNTKTQPSSARPRKGGLESAFQIILLLIGLGGVWYIRGGGQPTSVEAAARPVLVSAAANVQESKTLDIQGAFETGARVRFVIKGYQSHDQYLLDAGHGNRVAITGRTTAVTYDEAGIYQVKLWKKVEGSWRLLQSEHIQIEDHLGVVSR